MKIQHTIAFFLLVAASLTSCEMKDEIFDKNKISGDTGYLNLAVSVQNKATKAATDEGTNNNSPVSADNFEVEISNSEGTYEKKFDSYTELQAAGKIELPVGKYTIKAHTPGTIAPKMDYPFYKGEETLEITKGTEKTTAVICTMQNTKIQLIYGTTFATIFKEWDITISDGSSNILTYDESDLNPATKYWLIADNVSEIKVHIKAYLQDGSKIEEDRSITKPEDADSDFWAGSDALTITMEPGEPSTPDNPNGVTINVKVEISFTDDEVTEEIPVEGEGSDEGEDGGEEPVIPAAPTITSQYLTSGISYTITANPDANDSEPTSAYIMSGNPEKADVAINAEAGFKEISVKITTSNSGFGAAISAIGLNQSVNILDENLNEMLVQVLNPPSVGETEYTLNIASFFSMMNMYGPGTHTFDISVLDANNEEASASLTVTITLNE